MTDQYRSPIEVAWQEFGVFEIVGPRSEARIEEYHASCERSFDDDIAWCSSFRNWCQEKSTGEGTGTNKPTARSWQKWGVAISKIGVQYGDTVVFHQGDPNDWPGHVAFFISWSLDRKRILCLGGNQSNKVCVKWYSVSRLLSFQRGA